MSNKLIYEKSPYLLQHANNPVNWYPWCEEAFSKAEKEDKPIFLSVGYSTCHWCHVMEKECFEDLEIADFLNKYFIAIKVDREERPDIDNIYMSVSQALSGSGGWPMSIFISSDKKPFFAGTYFSKHDINGNSGFITVLKAIQTAWNYERHNLLETSQKIINTIKRSYKTSFEYINPELIDNAFFQFKYEYDSKHGGFGGSPKFPSPHILFFLLRYWHKTKDEDALTMVENTLISMYKGGIYDHIGYGFRRYATDKEWLVPHFEKMLYDNALLSIAYLETYQATKNNKYSIIAEQILSYVFREMTSTEGAFYSAEDADSENIEGKFYLWTYDEVEEILGTAIAKTFCKYFNITKKGNFEGTNIPNLINSNVPAHHMDSLNLCIEKLFKHREKRIHPHKDDKILTSWNGLMIAALAIAGRTLNNDLYTEAAEKAVEFIYKKLFNSTGRLLARYRDGESAHLGYADDYAYLIWGLIELYETTFKPEYLKRALNLNSDLIKYFWDSKDSGLFLYGSDAEELIIRPKEIYDGALPSANSVSALNFLRLSKFSGRFELETQAFKLLKSFGLMMKDYPRGFAHSMSALMFYEAQTKEILIVTDGINRDAQSMIEVLREEFRPFDIPLVYSKESVNLNYIVPFVVNYKPLNDQTTAFICKNFTCESPITEINEFRSKLNN